MEVKLIRNQREPVPFVVGGVYASGTDMTCTILQVSATGEYVLANITTGYMMPRHQTKEEIQRALDLHYTYCPDAVLNVKVPKEDA